MIGRERRGEGDGDIKAIGATLVTEEESGFFQGYDSSWSLQTDSQEDFPRNRHGGVCCPFECADTARG